MSIIQSQSRTHWNYFLALEADFLRLARFVEPAPDNYGTYSIELARLLISASSEVDVVLKMICGRIEGAGRAQSINKYREFVKPKFPFLEQAVVTVPRYGLEFVPWDNWQSNTTPNWWNAHNSVKHRRDTEFSLGSMQHAINAMGGLFLCLLVHYGFEDPSARLMPVPSLFEVAEDVARVHQTLNGKTILHFDEVGWVHTYL